MKVWLDDLRPAPQGWLLVCNYEDCIRLIEDRGDEISEISLDHDLGERHYQSDFSDARTGYDVLRFLLASGYRPLIHVHTMNAIGMQRMLDLLENFEGE